MSSTSGWRRTFSSDGLRMGMGPIASLYLSWGLTAFWPITGKAAASRMDAILFNFSALTVGCLVLLPWMLSRERWRRLFEPKLRTRLFLLGAFGSGLASVLLTIGVSLTTSANAAIVCQIEVVYSAILAALMLGERISGRQAAASTLVILGTALILGKDLGTPHWKGDLLILVTPWMFQVSHVILKRLPIDIEEVTIAFARIFYGWLVLAPLAAWRLLSGTPRFELSVNSALLIAFHGIVLGSLSVVLWYTALRRLELAKTTAIMLSYPALTLLYCRVLGIERIGWHQLAGLALSLSGALWLTLQIQRSNAPAARTVEV